MHVTEYQINNKVNFWIIHNVQNAVTCCAVMSMARVTYHLEMANFIPHRIDTPLNHRWMITSVIHISVPTLLQIHLYTELHGQMGEILFVYLFAICLYRPIDRTVASGVVVVVVVGVCNRSQMRTSKCTFNFWCEYRSWPWLEMSKMNFWLVIVQGHAWHIANHLWMASSSRYIFVGTNLEVGPSTPSAAELNGSNNSTHGRMRCSILGLP